MSTQWEYDLQHSPDSPTNQTASEGCEYCGLNPDNCECYSSCCGAFMGAGNGDGCFSDYGICPECGEHI